MYSSTEIMPMATTASAPAILAYHLRRSKSFEHAADNLTQPQSPCSTTTLLLQRAASMRVTTATPPSEQQQPRSDAAVLIPDASPLCRKKRVCFGDNNNNNTSCQQVVAIIPRCEDPSILWWDQVDFAARRYLDAVVVDKYALNETDQIAYQAAIVYLLSSFQPEKQSRAALTEHVRVVRAANVRGLESRMVPLLKYSRRHGCSEILKLQRKLRQGNLRPEMAATMLRRKSLKLSRASRQLAFRMAQADRMDVLKDMTDTC